MNKPYDAADLVADILGPAFEWPNPRATHRRNRCIANLVLTPEVNNTLIIELVDDHHVALALGYRSSDGQIVTGEVIVPRQTWSTTTFAVYAFAQRNRPH